MPRRKPGETPILTRRRIGRPPKDPFEVIDRSEAGAPITAADKIVSTLEGNGFQHDAAARAGVTAETLRAWRTKGARAQGDLVNGRRQLGDLDDHEAACVELSRRMDRAEANAKAALLDLLTTAAVGGLQQVRITEQVDPETGAVLSRRIETVTLPADVRAAMWILSHCYREFRGHVEVSGTIATVAVEVSAKDQLNEALDRAASRLGLGAGNGQAGNGEG